MRSLDLDHQWIINAAQAKQLIAQGATVIDVRNIGAWFLGHIPGAVHVTWQQFSQPSSHRGKLIEDSSILEGKLRAIGISNHKPVVVVGNPAHNFGEEGRIVWMLRTLGHSQAAFVDGGYDALINTGIAISWGLTQVETGDFCVQRTATWEIQRDELKANLGNQILIDTRTAKEYAGATPYGEQRGGHLLGARHFYFKELIDLKGNLLPKEQIMTSLAHLGIQAETPIVAYCTGGVRSAFFVAVLAHFGFTQVKNYAGSLWEWSASPATDYPLQKLP